MKPHTIRLHFDETPEDQALYAALRASCERECRTPLPRQAKYLLGMAMGLIQADLFLLKRLGLSSIDPKEFAANAAAVYVSPPPTRPPTTLRLIQGGQNGQSEAEPRVRQCTECKQVWLPGEPSASRQPATCPNDCNAAVLELIPSTPHDEPKESSMNMLAIDVPIENLSDVLNDLDHSCGALRRVRDTLTNEEGWDHDRHRVIKTVIAQGLLLASVIRHMEQLIEQGHRYEFARLRTEPSEVTAA